MSESLKEQILQVVREDLLAVESALEKNLTPQVDLVRQVAGHLIFSGGKRFRPLLMLLSARMCGYREDRAIHYSTIFEYLHAATLLHDDLVDGAALRRGRKAAYTIYGNETAVLTGDFLLARSLTIASDTGNPRVIAVIAGITEAMSQGEIEQLNRRGDLSLTEAEYLEVIRRKTAVLFQGACRTGALVAGAGDTVESALDTYGYHLGIAFQMADDLLDYLQQASVMGKSAGTDLKEGKLTLPLIIALQNASASEGDFIRKMIGKTDFSDAEFEEFLEILNHTGGIAYAKRSAETHVAKAQSALNMFPPSPERDTLARFADYSLKRGH